MKISKKLTIALLVISLVPLVLASAMAYLLAERALKWQVFDQLESVANVQHNRIEAIGEQNLERLVLVSSRTQLRVSLADYIKEGEAAEQQKMNSILMDARSSIASFEEIHILTRDGVTVASTDTMAIGTVYRDEQFFTGGLGGNSNDVFFLDADDRVKLYLSGPLYLDGEQLGLVVIKSSADNIISAVTDYTALGATGETQLAQRSPNGDALFLTPLRFDDRAALTRAASGDNFEAPVIHALSGDETVVTDAVDYRGEPVFAATRYIAGSDWGLVVKIDKAEALAPIRELRAILATVIVVSIVVIILVSIYIARSITRPIGDLTRAAGAISGGDLSQRAEVTSRDEVGALARAFNQMADNLIEANAELEGKVQERTTELVRSNAELEDFTHVVSHDLKEPLRGIEAFSGFLAEDYADKLDERGQGYVTILQDSAVRMRDLIDDLLELSRIGRVKPQYVVVSGATLVGNVINDMQFSLTEKKVDLRVEQNLSMLVCDVVRIRQVFANLISNAIKYNDKAQTVIEIGYSARPGEHVFLVRDNGPGIDPTYHEKVFRIFQRLVRREEHEGTGVGLTTCKKIIEGHGGRIWVESNGAGEGSTFFFSIPTSIEPSDLAKEEQNGTRPTAGTYPAGGGQPSGRGDNEEGTGEGAGQEPAHSGARRPGGA